MIGTGGALVRYWGALGLSLCCFTSEGRAAPELIRTNPEGRLPAYQISIETRVGYARRYDFSEPVFLFQQPVDTIVAHEVRTELTLEAELFPALVLRVMVPFSNREADVLFAPILISQEHQVAPRWLDLDSHGVADPKAELVVRPYETERLKTEIVGGVSIPRDDNPGSNTVPKRLPLGTGQSEFYLEPTLQFEISAWAFGSQYHLGFHPGNTASYLVRKVGVQSYASGALGPYLGHVVSAWGQWSVGRWHYRVTPSLTVDENPFIIERGQAYQISSSLLRYDLGLEARLLIDLVAEHRVGLFFKHWFLRAWEEDPFFPIQIPDQGFGIFWQKQGF